MNKAILVTGASGGIGQAICSVFKNAGYYVIGIDKQPIALNCDKFLQFDLSKISIDPIAQERLENEIHRLENYHVLVNNAAVQILSKTEEINLSDWNETMAVNLTAPMLLSKFSIPSLSKSNGSIVNISSIHQMLTKPAFVSYATSKSALVGLTKAMAVDLNGKVRVNSISPAAIETDMLKSGFDNNELALQTLKKLHPMQRIGYPIEVANLTLFLAGDSAKFINGSNLQIDGGISSVLNDV